MIPIATKLLIMKKNNTETFLVLPYKYTTIKYYVTINHVKWCRCFRLR